MWLFKSIFEDIFLLSENNKQVSDNCFFEIWVDKTDYYRNTLNKASFDKIIVALRYEENLQKILKKIKYSYNKELLSLFEPYLRKMIDISWEDYENAIVIGIPMFFYNRLIRGYNQSYILAKAVSEISWIRFEKVLIKILPSKSQARLNRILRINNLKNRFIINPFKKVNLEWKTVFVVDDVISTWSTFEKVSSILKQNWAKKVIWLFLSTGDII